MRIGLVSDTHIPEAAQALPPQIAEVFQDVDLILHAGDIYLPSALDELQRIAPVLAARGDDDCGDMLRDKRVKWKHVLNLEGQRLWLIHDMPYSRMVTPWRRGKSSGKADEDAPDIIVFGHDHSTIMQRRNGVLFINPGSPTFLNYRSGLGTVAVLEIDSVEAQVDILQL